MLGAIPTWLYYVKSNKFCLGTLQMQIVCIEIYKLSYNCILSVSFQLGCSIIAYWYW